MLIHNIFKWPNYRLALTSDIIVHKVQLWMFIETLFMPVSTNNPLYFTESIGICKIMVYYEKKCFYRIELSLKKYDISSIWFSFFSITRDSWEQWFHPHSLHFHCNYQEDASFLSRAMRVIILKASAASHCSTAQLMLLLTVCWSELGLCHFLAVTFSWNK